MVARLLNNLAIQKRRAGDLNGSLTLNREALAIRREIGDRVNLAVSLNNIGNVLLDLGDLDGAVAHYEEAAGIHREIGDRRGLARARNNAAVALKMQGQLARARAANEEALTIRRDISDPGSAAISLFNIGELLVLQGDLPKAAQSLDEALAIQRKLDIGRGVGYSLFDSATSRSCRATRRSRESACEESLDTADEARREADRGRLPRGAGARRARRGQDRGRRTAGAGRRRARTSTRTRRMVMRMARTALARALMAAGRVDGALAEADRADALVRDAQNVLAKLTVAIPAARILARARPRSTAEAVAHLEAAGKQATALGLVPLGYDASLALAEVIAQSDRGAAEVRLCGARKRRPLARIRADRDACRGRASASKEIAHRCYCRPVLTGSFFCVQSTIDPS